MRTSIAMPASNADAPRRVGFLRKHVLFRAAVEKFSGAWLACFVVMSRGDVAFAFSAEHARIAAICGAVGAAIAIALLAQMDQRTDSAARHATISAVATFIGDVVARPMHSSPYWAEPALTATISGIIAVVLWHVKQRVLAYKP